MTTSNSSTFNPVRDTIIKGALRLVNAYASTGNPSPDQINDALESLNLILKSWQVEGFLWLKQFATLSCVSGQAQYTLPGPETVYDSTGAQIARPTRITNPTRRTTTDGADIPMGDTGKTISREEYSAIPNKTSPGVPIFAYYDPQLSVGNLYLWPVPDTNTIQIKFTCDRPIQDMLSDTDTFDVPQEQVRRIKYALALEIAPEYALPAGDYDRLAKRHEEIREALSDFDQEAAPTQFIMGHR
jgi:hypothetical protein